MAGDEFLHFVEDQEGVTGCISEPTRDTTATSHGYRLVSWRQGPKALRGRLSEGAAMLLRTWLESASRLRFPMGSRLTRPHWKGDRWRDAFRRLRGCRALCLQSIRHPGKPGRCPTAPRRTVRSCQVLDFTAFRPLRDARDGRDAEMHADSASPLRSLPGRSAPRAVASPR